MPVEPRHLEGHEEVDLRVHLAALARRKWWIITCLLLGAGIAAGITLQQTPRYQASADVLLQADGLERRFAGDTRSPVATNHIENEIAVIESGTVRDAVAEEVGRAVRAGVAQVGTTDVVRITVTDEDPEAAAAHAQRYAQTYVDWKRSTATEDLAAAQGTVRDEIERLEAELVELEKPIKAREAALFASQSDAERDAIRAELVQLEAETGTRRSSLQSTVALYQSELSALQVSQRVMRTGGVQLLTGAATPTTPISPDPVRNGTLGIVGGLLVGIGFAFLREVLDDRIRTKEELEARTGWPVVGTIPTTRPLGAGRRHLPTVDASRSPAAEAFRSLRTAVQFVGVDRPMDIIQVTSPKAGDGKTTTATNLAIALAAAGKRVVLLDADLRRPRVHEQFGLSNALGFTSMLVDHTVGERAGHDVGIERLVVIPSGPRPSEPAELLSTPSTRRAIDEIAATCDVLVVDSPPVLPVTDALVLSAYVDAVLVVARAGSVRAKELQRARELLVQASAPVIGVCVNQVAPDGGAYGYGYGYEADDDEVLQSPPSRAEVSR